MDLKELDFIDPNTHWYYQAKLFAVKFALDNLKIAPSKIIDIGAGSGFFSTSLATNYIDCDVVCVDPNYTDEQLVSTGSVQFTKSISAQKGDLYLLMDVLEHVEDDLSLLKSSLLEAKPGATILITVPAFQALWSPHDIYLEHLRRYKLTEVVSLAEECELSVVRSCYLFSFLFPFVWIYRKFKRFESAQSNMRPSNRILNRILKEICFIEFKNISNKKYGISAMVIATKI